jgi:hypothetical protein
MGDAFIKGSGATSATTALLVLNSALGSLLALRNDFTATLGDVGSSARLAFSNNNYSITAGTGQPTMEFKSIFNTATIFTFATNSNLSNNNTSGTNIFVSFPIGFAPTSGTGTWTSLSMTPTINQTGGANGITRGLYVNPTLTSAADWRSIEWSNNTGWGLYGAGTAPNFLSGSLGIGSTNLTASNLRLSKNISGSSIAYGIYQEGVVQTDVTSDAHGFMNVLQTAASANFVNYYHLRVRDFTIGGGTSIAAVTGLQVDDISVGTNRFGIRSSVSSGTNRWNLYMQGTADNYLAGKLLIGTTTVSTFALDVNGTARVSGVSMLLTGSNGGGNDVKSSVVNTNGAGSANIACFNNTSNFIDSGIYGTTVSGTFANVSYANQAKIQTSATNFILSTTGGDKPIIFAVNATSTTGEVARFNSTSLTFSDGINIILNATTGTKIGTATSQKLSLWNATPIVQPTTAIAEAAFVENLGGSIVNVDSTFDGYTMQQVVKALRNMGALA